MWRSMTIQDLSKGYIPVLLAISLGIGLTMAGIETGIFIESMREDHSALLSLKGQVAEIKKMLEGHVPCISGSVAGK
jgi:hypothetical protein